VTLAKPGSANSGAQADALPKPHAASSAPAAAPGSLVVQAATMSTLERARKVADAVVALAPAALTELGAVAGTPVRVRRVNPPEEERAALRAGRSAPARMDTPASLLAVLKRKLPGAGSASLGSTPAPTAVARLEGQPGAPRPLTGATAKAPAAAGPRGPANTAPLKTAAVQPVQTAGATNPAATAVAHVEAAPAPSATPRSQAAAHGAFQVQAATMSTAERARAVASAVGGSVAPAGKYFRVRTGPFANRKEAEASLAKVRAAGYSDARILTNG
jgi:rare lipoprotein A